MNWVIYIFLAIGFIYTVHKYMKFIKGNYIIPPRFFLSWKFIVDVLVMLLIAVGVFYAKYPLTEIDIFIVLFVGFMIGFINATIGTGKEKRTLMKS